MEVKWLKKALSNLDKGAECITQDNPQAASIVVQRIKKGVGLLKANPSLGCPGRIEGTRELVIDKTSYIVPYRVCNNRVEILRVFHTSRKLPDRWSFRIAFLKQKLVVSVSSIKSSVLPLLALC